MSSPTPSNSSSCTLRSLPDPTPEQLQTSPFIQIELLWALGPELKDRKWDLPWDPELFTIVNAFEPGHAFTEAEILGIASYHHQIPLLETLRFRRRGYNVTVYDLYNSEYFPPALVRAASNPNSEILEAVLSFKDPQYDPSVWWADTSPLIAAIEARLLHNVVLLLKHGADPNGCSQSILSDYSAQFLRFRLEMDESDRTVLDRAIVLAEIGIAGYPLQSAPLTEAELQCRSMSKSLFWAETDVHPQDFGYLTPRRLSLEFATMTGDISLVDVLLKGGADTQGWRNQYNEIPLEPSISYLAPSTPLHEAIRMGDVNMAKYLVSKGLNVNVFPLASITYCINPIMATITAAPNKLAMFEALVPTADLALRTKIFDVNILHLAVATHDIALILRINEHLPFSAAGTTALGHTLLHIACLPSSASQINSFSPEIQQSIHDTGLPLTRIPSRPDDFYSQPDFVSTWPSFKPSESDDEDQTAQFDTINFLISSSDIDVDIGAADIYGNTALHYLASYCIVNHDAIGFLKRYIWTGDLWATSRNKWGFSAKDLFQGGEIARKNWLNDNCGH